MASLGALVIELSANTARLSSDMGKAVGIVQGAYGRITSIFRTLGVAAGAGGLASVALKSIELGDNLNKAAIKAGIGAHAISELAYAAKQSDIDLNTLSASIRKMQVNLSNVATGAKEPALALRALGIAFDEIKKLSPDQQFELIADRISKLKDPADRARAATELFGKAGADLLPLFEQGAEGIRKAREEAQRLGVSFGPEQLKKLVDADTAVKQLTSAWQGFATSLTATVAPAITNVLNLLRGDAKALFGGGGSLTGTLDEQLKFAESRLALAKAGGSEERIREMETEVRRLNLVINGADDFASRRGRARDAANQPIGFEAAKDATDDLETLSAVVVTAQKVHAQTLQQFEEQTRTSTQNEIHAYDEKYAAIQQLEEEAYISKEDALARLAELEDEFNRNSLAQVVVTAQRVGKTTNEMTEFAKRAASNMQDALAQFLFDPFNDGLKGMLKSFINTIRQIAAQAAAAKIFGSKSSGGFGLGDLITTGVGAALSYGGGKAMGGPLEQGKWYTAGEHGPEPIWGGGQGAFAAGYGKGGSAPVTVNIDARGADIGVAKRMELMIPGIVRQAVDMSRAAFRDDLSRGAYRGAT